MFVRHLGCGVGLLELQARAVEQMPLGDLDFSRLDSVAMPGDGMSGEESDEEEGMHEAFDNDEPEEEDPTNGLDPLAEL